MSESVTIIVCPKCKEKIEYSPAFIRSLRNNEPTMWICPSCGEKTSFQEIVMNSVTQKRNIPSYEYTKYEHHDNNVWVRKDLKGKHREYCLCYHCEHLNVHNKSKNCPIANALFEFNKSHGIITPVWECVQFKEKKQ